jgi:hypothetical protein
MARIVTRGEGEATAFKLNPDSDVEDARDHPSVSVRRSNLKRRIMKNRERQASRQPAMDQSDSGDDSEQSSQGEDPYQNAPPGRGFEDFANMTKAADPRASDSGSEASSMQGFSGPTPPLHQQHQQVPDSQIPRTPFSSIEEEKQDILLKFKRLREKNVKLSQQFGPHSSITDLRTEYDTLKRNAEMEGSVKFQRRALIAICSGLEWANKRFDPFNLELNGWSETIAEDIDSFDPTFEKLHAKYSGKASLPPEAELMLSLAGSAFSFHLSNQFFKSALGGGLGGAGGGAERPSQQTMASIFEKLQKEMSQSSSPPAQPQPQPPAQQAQAQDQDQAQRQVPANPQMIFTVPTNFMPNPINTVDENKPRIMELQDTDSEDSVSVSSATSHETASTEQEKVLTLAKRPTTRAGRGRGRGRGTSQGRGIVI